MPDPIKPIYDLVLKNQLQTQKDMKERASIRILSKNVENDFKLNGYSLVHSLGHGVGLRHFMNFLMLIVKMTTT